MGDKKYYLGLDMGTNSVGWAVTDEKYCLLKAKGKDLWGIREFDEASTAVDRRMHRVSRRRRQRQVVRIGLLKDYFSDQIEKVDPYFYQRLENSKYYLEDKDEQVKDKNALFNDPGFNDRDYFKNYPTIFHLRKELIENPAPHDVRLVFLALLNMFKHRGHFLNAGLDSEGDSLGNMSEIYREFAEITADDLDFPIETKGEKIEDILSSRDHSRSVKSEMLIELFGFDKKDKKRREFVRAICGLKTDTTKLFGDDQGFSSEEKTEFSFSDAAYDEKVPDIVSIIGEDRYYILELMKAIYDKGTLSEILKGSDYLSQARVASYNKHSDDLLRMKKVVRKYGSPEEYDFFFRSTEDGSYSSYVGTVNSGKKKRRSMKGDFISETNKYMTKLKKDHEDDQEIDTILNDIALENFMPKQLTSSNGIIPYQVHLKEMKKILGNAEGYLPFLIEKDESGLSVSERIIQLFSFQIPYYVGPITSKSQSDGGNGWVVRKDEGTVLPWNIHDKIDMEKTQEEFIKKLIRKCTYISGETVLPKCSLLYEKFSVLNEINNLRIDNERIDPELKQDIYNDLFLAGKAVTKKQLMKYLMNRGLITQADQVSGADITSESNARFNSALSSYGKFISIFGSDKMKEDQYQEMAEHIIYLVTIFGDSKSVLRDYLKREYGTVLNEEQIKKITGMKFRDWGRLSKAFLELHGCNKADGESKSIVRAMWDNNLNLMELINSDEYTYKDELFEKTNVQTKCLAEFKAEDLDEYYFSAPVKRMIWQTVLLIKEIEYIMGGAPDRVFIEMTRKPEDKPTRKDSRKKKFMDLYSNIKEEQKYWKDLIETSDSNGTIRSKKMFLYLTQMGRDMYTGKQIELDRLFDDNLYDIDHIYPRHFVKDDNLQNNLVLVDKRKNARKSDNYPLEKEISSNPEVVALWKTLHEKKLITDEKYRRLTGRTPFTDEQKAGFIARQLVETGQGTKGVADILKMLLPKDTTIVYAKASNASEFRHKFDLPKSRLVNDFHHANDAYLNIVVGNVYYTKFTQNPLNYIKNEYRKNSQNAEYNLDKMFDRDVIRGDQIAWKASKKDGEAGTITTVKKMMQKNTPLLTRYSFVAHGGITRKDTIWGKEVAKTEGYIPLKASDKKLKDVTKYGGFNNVSGAYFFLVEYEKKRKKERSLEVVPIYLVDRFENNVSELEKYCREELGLANASVRMSKIRIQSLISIDGYRLHISGKSENRILLRNACSMCLNTDWIKYIQKIEKYVETEVLDEEILNKQKNERLYNILKEKHLYQIYSYRPNSIGEKLEKAEVIFCGLDVKKQCSALYQLLQLTSIGPAIGDLTLLKESKNSGTMRMSKNISGNKDLYLINQSVTGVYENKIDLLTV